MNPYDNFERIEPEPCPEQSGHPDRTVYNQKANELLNRPEHDSDFLELEEAYLKWCEEVRVNGGAQTHAWDMNGEQSDFASDQELAHQDGNGKSSVDYVAQYKRWIESLEDSNTRCETLEREYGYPEYDGYERSFSHRPMKRPKRNKALPPHVYRHTERLPILTLTSHKEHTKNRGQEIKKLTEIFANRLIAALEQGQFARAQRALEAMRAIGHNNNLLDEIYPDFVHAAEIRHIPEYKMPDFVKVLRKLAGQEYLSVSCIDGNEKSAFSEISICLKENGKEVGKVLVSRKAEKNNAARRGIVSLRRSGEQYSFVSKLINEALDCISQTTTHAEKSKANGLLKDTDYVRYHHASPNGHAVHPVTIHAQPHENRVVLRPIIDRPPKKTVNPLPMTDPIGLRID